MSMISTLCIYLSLGYDCQMNYDHTLFELASPCPVKNLDSITSFDTVVRVPCHANVDSRIKHKIGWAWLIDGCAV